MTSQISKPNLPIIFPGTNVSVRHPHSRRKTQIQRGQISTNYKILMERNFIENMEDCHTKQKRF